MRASKTYLSPEGIQKNLLYRLSRQEEFRMKISKGQINEEYASDPVEGAMARIQANYHSGLM